MEFKGNYISTFNTYLWNKRLWREKRLVAECGGRESKKWESSRSSRENLKSENCYRKNAVGQERPLFKLKGMDYFLHPFPHSNSIKKNLREFYTNVVPNRTPTVSRRRHCKIVEERKIASVISQTVAVVEAIATAPFSNKPSSTTHEDVR